MVKTKSKSSYPLRLSERVRQAVKAESERNRHSLNIEIEMLIEDGLKWREMQCKQAAA